MCIHLKIRYYKFNFHFVLFVLETVPDLERVSVIVVELDRDGVLVKGKVVGIPDLVRLKVGDLLIDGVIDTVRVNGKVVGIPDLVTVKVVDLVSDTVSDRLLVNG